MALFLSQNMSPSPDARCVPNIVKPLVLCSNTITQKGSLYMQLYDPQATRASRERERRRQNTYTNRTIVIFSVKHVSIDARIYTQTPTFSHEINTESSVDQILCNEKVHFVATHF